MNASRIRLGYGHLTVEIAAAEAAVLEWLTEFMTPSFAHLPTATREPDHRIHFDVDADTHAQLMASLAAALPATLEGFTLDGRFTTHRGWTDGRGRRWIYDERNVFCGIDGPGRDIRVVAATDTRRTRITLMRAVREVATASALDACLLPLHGAAFQRDDGVVLVCGPKRSGKTSLLIHALLGGGQFVSNDRLFVDLAAPAVVRGMPTIVGLRHGALDLFPTVKQAFDVSRFDYGRTIAECGAGIERPAPRPGPGLDRPGISPAQFCRLVGAASSAGGAIRMILLPRVDADVAGIAWTRLEPAAALAGIRASLFKPSTPIRGSEVFGRAERRPELGDDLELDLCRRLVAAVPVYGCALGRGAYAAPLPSTIRASGESSERAG